jgi:hypothetical protein
MEKVMCAEYRKAKNLGGTTTIPTQTENDGSTSWALLDLVYT